MSSAFSLNRGFYTIDIRFFYRIECEVSCVVGRPRIIDGLAVFDKRVILFGGEGGARIFSSHYVEDGADVQLCPDSNKPTAVVEVVDPHPFGCKHRSARDLLQLLLLRAA